MIALERVRLPRQATRAGSQRPTRQAGTRDPWRGPGGWSVHVVSYLCRVSGISRALAALAAHRGWDVPRLVTLDVAVPALPPALIGLRIGHLSDLHVGALVPPAMVTRAVTLLQAAAPDLIAITGDLVDTQPADAVPAAQALAPLRAPLGVWACLGNHDHKAGAPIVQAALASQAPHIRLLTNRAARVAVGTAELWVAGLDSAAAEHADAPAAFRMVPAQAACLLLQHEPDAVDALPRRVMLTLAGHSHGGQVRLAGRPVLLPPLGRRYPGGLAQTPAGPLYVSRGVGWSGVPIRLNCPPEVTLLRLVSTW